MYGRQHLQPRLSAWVGDPGLDYRYSGLVLRPCPWTALLLRIRHDVERHAGHRFNSVLLNLYRDGRDAIGWHSDDEPELGVMPVIACLSFGATRTFRMRHKSSTTQPPLSLPLADGSLLVMAGRTQSCWRHAIPREPKVERMRISLTFRQIGPRR